MSGTSFTKTAGKFSVNTNTYGSPIGLELTHIEPNGTEAIVRLFAADDEVQDLIYLLQRTLEFYETEAKKRQ